MAHLKELKEDFPRYKVKIIAWECLEAIPFDFFRLEEDVKHLFVRNLLIEHFRKMAEEDVNEFEQDLREVAVSNIETSFKNDLLSVQKT